jgi:hypothetical protein
VDPAKAVNGETDITFVSRWIGSGAGRADAYATRLANFHLAADCWGPDTIATYVSRRGQLDQGSDSLCVYALPPEISHGSCPLD